SPPAHNITDCWPFCAANESRCSTDTAEGTHRRIDTTWHQFHSALEELLRFSTWRSLFLHNFRISRCWERARPRVQMSAERELDRLCVCACRRSFAREDTCGPSSYAPLLNVGKVSSL